MPKEIEFSNPPLNEVICGIQYKTTTPYNFTLEYDFYNRVKEALPKVEKIMPIINSQQEFEASIGVPRYFLKSNEEEKLIQLQAEKFFFNWRKLDSHAIPYPRFSTVYSEFNDYWRTFSTDVLQDKNIAISNLELTYINSIDIQSSSETITPLAKVFSFFHNTANILDSDEFNMTFGVPIDQCAGKMVCTLTKTSRKDNNKKILLFQISILGKLSEGISLEKWFSNAHCIILEYFDKYTSEEAKNSWGMEK
jgi:uncharacterized protein (TIGR04255 family)